jgi:transcriptional regulator with XRE-family HTH domain
MDAVARGSGRRKAARLVSEARRRAGLGQTDLARLAGIPLRTLTRIEAGEAVPRIDTVERLLLGCGRTLTAEPRPVAPDAEEETSVPNLAQGLRFLSGAYVSHVLVGELAAHLHGARVNVTGLDIVVPDIGEQRRRLLRALENLDRPYSRVPVRVEALRSERFHRIWRAAAMLSPVPSHVASLDDLIERERDEARRCMLAALREEMDRGSSSSWSTPSPR